MHARMEREGNLLGGCHKAQEGGLVCMGWGFGGWGLGFGVWFWGLGFRLRHRLQFQHAQELKGKEGASSGRVLASRGLEIWDSGFWVLGFGFGFWGLG